VLLVGASHWSYRMSACVRASAQTGMAGCGVGAGHATEVCQRRKLSPIGRQTRSSTVAFAVGGAGLAQCDGMFGGEQCVKDAGGVAQRGVLHPVVCHRRGAVLLTALRPRLWADVLRNGGSPSTLIFRGWLWRYTIDVGSSTEPPPAPRQHRAQVISRRQLVDVGWHSYEQREVLGEDARADCSGRRAPVNRR
jgi:hypothetical protein